ncbi:uncharacterized protein LOC144301242 [Canis aureus]
MSAFLTYAVAVRIKWNFSVPMAGCLIIIALTLCPVEVQAVHLWQTPVVCNKWMMSVIISSLFYSEDQRGCRVPPRHGPYSLHPCIYSASLSLIAVEWPGHLPANSL